MPPLLWIPLVAGAVVLPAWAQTQVWSAAPATQRWSEAPAAVPTPAPAATSGPSHWSAGHALPASQGAGRTEPWAAPVHTQRRSAAEVQRQVDGIVRDAERRSRSVGAPPRSEPGRTVPDQVWRDHQERMRAQEDFRRSEDAHDERQRDFNRR